MRSSWMNVSTFMIVFLSKAHCRDLERLGYPSPCPVEQLLLDPPSQQSTLDAPEMRRPSAETVEAEGLMMM